MSSAGATEHTGIKRQTAGRRGLPRWIEVVLAVGGLVLASPVVLAAAVALKVDSHGPILYRQARVGQHGAIFEILKLRTMIDGAPLGSIWDPLEEDDPRITRVGAFLRRTSLDEIPNLINVLRGEMALVGPRPTIAEQVAQYTPRQRRRLDVKPGLTGWAQVNGRSSLPWNERIELDVWYVANRSVRLDARILGKTVRMLVPGSGPFQG